MTTNSNVIAFCDIVASPEKKQRCVELTEELFSDNAKIAEVILKLEKLTGKPKDELVKIIYEIGDKAIYD